MRAMNLAPLVALLVLGTGCTPAPFTGNSESAEQPRATTGSTEGAEARFLGESLTKALPRSVEDALTWPSAEEVQSRSANGPRAAEAKAAAAGWVRTVLQPQWIPGDLENHLLALEADVTCESWDAPNRRLRVQRCDAIRWRHRAAGHQILFVQTSANCIVAIKAEPSPPAPGSLETYKDRVAGIVRLVFTQADNIIACSIAPAVVNGSPVDLARYGEHVARGRPQDPRRFGQWYGTVSWWTDGTTAVFTFIKVSGGPTDAPVLADWF